MGGRVPKNVCPKVGFSTGGMTGKKILPGGAED